MSTGDELSELEACQEVAAALRSGDPAAYESCLPVHQDGSCNGLQHYAALGRDTVGGRAVNLIPAERPQDVYSGVADIVRDKVAQDAQAGNPVAKILDGDVDRKLVKQTVMTSVYGVTFVGAREQIGNRLYERGWDDDKVIFRVATYAAKVTMSSIQEMFSGAKLTMKWLADCARLIAAQNEVVQWTSPIGLPVVQPYRASDRFKIQCASQRVVVAANNDQLPVHKSRQKAAFPPNYVHSIDASHMMMTAIECDRAGIAFAGVHDSFWTHAATVDAMNKAIRKNFVELHSQPLLEMLHEELQDKYPDLDFPPVPATGDLDIRAVEDSKYFFS